MAANVSATHHHTSALPVESDAVIMLQITTVQVVKKPAFIVASAALGATGTAVMSSLILITAQAVATTIVKDVMGFPPLVDTRPAPTVACSIAVLVANPLPTKCVHTANTTEQHTTLLCDWRIL